MSLALVGVDAEEIENLVALVSAVAARVDADSREFAALTPALNSEWGDS